MSPFDYAQGDILVFLRIPIFLLFQNNISIDARVADHEEINDLRCLCARDRLLGAECSIVVPLNESEGLSLDNVPCEPGIGWNIGEESMGEVRRTKICEDAIGIRCQEEDF